MKQYTVWHVVIYGTFPTLNEFISALNSRNHAVGNNFKKRAEQEIIKQLNGQIVGEIETPVSLDYHFYEPNRKRDKDNVSAFFHKVFQDALVKGGYIPNDGWACVESFSDSFEVDNLFPRIEVKITSKERI